MVQSNCPESLFLELSQRPAGVPNPHYGDSRDGPELVLITVEVGSAERLLGMTIPAAPKTSADLARAPRFWGSWTWSTKMTKVGPAVIAKFLKKLAWSINSTDKTLATTP